jgi:hypothetical protein
MGYVRIQLLDHVPAIFKIIEAVLIHFTPSVCCAARIRIPEHFYGKRYKRAAAFVTMITLPIKYCRKLEIATIFSLFIFNLKG